jgi:hypothetical protein
MCSAKLGFAQATTSAPAPTNTATTANINTSKFETEVVTITDFEAIPSTITRKQGPFFLLLVNKTRRNTPNIVLDSPTASAAQIPLLAQTLNLSMLANSRRLPAMLNPPLEPIN